MVRDHRLVVVPPPAILRLELRRFVGRESREPLAEAVGPAAPAPLADAQAELRAGLAVVLAFPAALGVVQRVDAVARPEDVGADNRFRFAAVLTVRTGDV